MKKSNIYKLLSIVSSVVICMCCSFSFVKAEDNIAVVDSVRTRFGNTTRIDVISADTLSSLSPHSIIIEGDFQCVRVSTNHVYFDTQIFNNSLSVAIRYDNSVPSSNYTVYFTLPISTSFSKISIIDDVVTLYQFDGSVNSYSRSNCTLDSSSQYRNQGFRLVNGSFSSLAVNDIVFTSAYNFSSSLFGFKCSDSSLNFFSNQLYGSVPPTPTASPTPTPTPSPNPNFIKYKFNSYVSSSDSYVYGGSLNANNLTLGTGSMTGLSMSLQATNLTFDAVSTNYSLVNGNKDKIYYVDKWKLAMNPNALLSQGGSANLTSRYLTGGFTIVNQQIKHNYYINNVITFDKAVDGILTYYDGNVQKSVYLVNNSKYEYTSQYEMKNIDVSQLTYSKGTQVDFNKDSQFYRDDSGTSDNLQNKNDLLSNSVKDYTNMEDSYMNDMKNNFDGVNTNSDLLKQNGFLNSAKWVSSQFNQLVDVKTSDGSQPFKLMLFFSLILGIALIMLGKIRR